MGHFRNFANFGIIYFRILYVPETRLYVIYAIYMCVCARTRARVCVCVRARVCVRERERENERENERERKGDLVLFTMVLVIRTFSRLLLGGTQNQPVFDLLMTYFY
jgi:hypothetical protein